MQYHAFLITADGAYDCPVGSIMAIFLHNSGCDGCDKYEVWLSRIKKGTFVYACLGHGCDGGFTLVPGNVKGRGFKSLNNVDHHE